MLRENHRIIVRLHRTADILITVACFVAAYFIKRNLLPGGLGGLILFKYMVFRILKRFRRIGYNTRYVLIIGSKDRAGSASSRAGSFTTCPIPRMQTGSWKNSKA